MSFLLKVACTLHDAFRSLSCICIATSSSLSLISRLCSVILGEGVMF
jgi:hypothetical protein